MSNELGFQSALAATTRSAQTEALRSEANVLWRQLNVLQRRDRIETHEDTARLADAWLAHASVSARVKKVEHRADSDPAIAVLVNEMKMIDADLRGQLKRHAFLVGSMEAVLQPTRWARRILAQHKARLAAQERRRAARPQPRPTTARRPARTKRAALTGEQREKIERVDRLMRQAKNATADRRSAYLDQAARLIKSVARA